MVALPSTPSTQPYTSTIQDIVSLHNRMLEWQAVLDERPWEDEKGKSIEKARTTLEETLLVPAIDTFTAVVKDASKKLSDWTRVMNVMVALKKEDPFSADVEDAMDELKVAVKGLTVIMVALREKFYV